MKFPEKLDDRFEYPGMVRWFSPAVLTKVVKKVVMSTMFGQYADRRLVHAALDSPIDAKALDKRCGGEKGILGDVPGPINLDYVADLGDGFDSTYAIAYLIGQKALKFEGQDLKRADCLVMGGDQVYPDASRYDYEHRLKRPYQMAFPRSTMPGVKSPPVFLIPGNHDWYDGLTLFLANFCMGEAVNLGGWQASQNRSYFAVHLKDNWWIWGYDSQLGEDIDKPQADYFKHVAQSMKPGAKVIVCASVPTWLKADRDIGTDEGRFEFYRALDFIANKLREHCSGAKIPLVLSGDMHHYSRYVAKEADTQFITAGGGGAFLHPTHQLPDKIRIKWAMSDQHLELGHDRLEKNGKNAEAIYPPRDVSRHMALGNWKFLFNNPEFCLTLGGLYWLASLLVLWWRGYGVQPVGAGCWVGIANCWAGTVSQLAAIAPTPASAAVVGAFWFCIFNYTDISPRWLKYCLATVHATIHIAIVAISTALGSVALAPVLDVPLGEIAYFFGLLVVMLVAGTLGGIVWGLYLLLVSWKWKAHANDAFSAMRLDSFRHFLRIRIDGERLEVFPIAIDQSPKRQDWEFDKHRDPNDQDAPIVKPKSRTELREHLIEGSVRINAADVKPLD